MDVYPLRVHIVQDDIGVTGMRSSKDDYLELGGEVGEDVASVGADVDAGLDHLAGRESYGELDVVGRGEGVVAVNQRLVQVEHDCLFACVKRGIP